MVAIMNTTAAVMLRMRPFRVDKNAFTLLENAFIVIIIVVEIGLHDVVERFDKQ